MRFTLFVPVVVAKDVTSAIMVGSVTNMLRSSILTAAFLTQVMVKTVQNANDSE